MYENTFGQPFFRKSGEDGTWYTGNTWQITGVQDTHGWRREWCQVSSHTEESPEQEIIHACGKKYPGNKLLSYQQDTRKIRVYIRVYLWDRTTR